jgi:hypothetical protein
MSKVRLTGTTSGFTELTAPAVAGSNTITLPSGNGSANQLLKNGATAGSLEFASNVVIDSSGRLLVGTSSTLGNLETLQVNSTSPANVLGVYRQSNDASGPRIFLGKTRGSETSIVQNGDIIADIRFVASDGVDIASQAASIGSYVDGTPGANDMPGRLVFSTTADGASTPTERMRIASNGKVGIGTSSPAYRLDVQGGSQRILNQGTNSFLEIGNGTTTNQSAFIDLVGDTTYTDYGLRIIRGADGANSNSLIENRGTGSLVLSTADAGSISFYTNGINRAVIGSDGIVQITSPSTSQAFTVNATNAAFAAAVFVPTTTRAAGTNCLYIYGVANNILTFAVYNNGNVVNANNSYGAISDIKLKENIVDASSQWDDIKALQVRKYNFKEETGHQTHTQIGLVAQEAELISPGLVTEAFDRDEEGNELETTTKSINYSVLYMKAVKALQEAMERIEALEARITALEAN